MRRSLRAGRLWRKLTRASLGLLLGLVALIGAVAARAVDPPLLERARDAVFDSYQRLFPRSFEPAPVRVVAIDEEALARVGQWPWPRLELVNLVDRLQAMGAAVIGLDILLADPDRSSPRAIARWLAQLPELADLAARAATMPDGDALLAAALRKARVVTAFSLQPSGPERPLVNKAGIAVRHAPGELPTALALPGFTSAVTSLEPFQEAAAGNGFINLAPDADGIHRRAALLFAHDGKPVPSFAGELLRVAQGVPAYLVRVADGVIEEVRIGSVVVPTGPTAEIRLHLTGHRPERFVSAARVLSADIDPGLIEGQIVLVGMTAPGLADLHPTAIEAAALGVEIQAELLEQLALGAAVARPAWADGLEVASTALLGALMILLAARLPPLRCAAVGAGAAAGTILASLALFRMRGLLVDPVAPSLGGLVVYLVATAASFARTDRERRHVRRAFERYLAPAVVERLIEERGSLELGGETRELTVLFADIRGFTSLAERLDAQSLTRLVNISMTPLTAAILDAAGTVDKFMGDAVMAFWNAPLETPEHPRRASRAALQMRASMLLVNEQLKAQGILPDGVSPPGLGIGLNTGPCCVGNLGSDLRFDYSAIGDPVNLASRLESLCRFYNVEILVGERTATAAPDLAFLEIDFLRVKGKQRPERIYALLGDTDLAVTPSFGRLREAQHALLEAYRSLRLEAAMSGLAAVRALDHDGRLGGVLGLYENRLTALLAAPPGPDWDGVFVARSK